MKVIKLIVFIFPFFLFSCKTTKFVEKEKIVVDSTAIKQRDAIARVLKEEIERFEKEKEEWNNTGISFDTTPFESATKTVTKIIFDNGKIKSIEGNVKTLNQSLYEKQAEVYDAHSTIDSMGIEIEKLQVELSKKQVSVVKDIETKWYIPIWVWVVVALGVVFGSHPYVKNIYNKIKKSWQKT